MKVSLNNIWYSDNQRAFSSSKKLVYSDKGILTLSNDALEFKGKLTQLKAENIKSIDYKNQKLNWKTYVYFASLVIIIGVSSGNILYSIAMLIPGIVLGVIFGWYMFRWTVVVFEEDGIEKEAYFADGNLRGWSGLFGGNFKLFQRIKTAYNTT